MHILGTSSRLTLVLVGAICFGTTSTATAAPRVGLRGGLSSDPDQILFGGHLQISGFAGGGARRLVFEPNATIGLGDDVFVLQVSADFKYEFPLSGSSAMVHPILGISLIYYSVDSPVCDLPGADCDGTEVGVGLGVGFTFQQQMALDLVVGLNDEMPDIRVLFGYTF